MATQTSDKSTKSTTPEAKLSWLPKKTFELEMTIPWNTVQKNYEKVLQEATDEAEIKGFRKGKAPKEMVEKHVGKERLYSEVIQLAVSDAYIAAIQHHNLRPIVNPNVTPVSMKEEEDWVVKATSCEVPEVKLEQYEDAIKGLKAKKSLWTPDKAQTETKENSSSNQPTVDEIMEELLKHAKIEIPDMLLDSEVNRHLSSLVDQVNALGVTVQQYCIPE